MFSIREIFDLAIRIEKNGAEFYRDALSEVSDPSLVSLLQYLVDEEIEHREWFAQKKGKIKTNPDDHVLDEAGSTLLQNIMGDQKFALNELELSKIYGIKALLKHAIEFEKDTVLFFELIKSLVDDSETKKQLKEIIEEEKRHIQLLEKFVDKGMDEIEKLQIERKISNKDKNGVFYE